MTITPTEAQASRQGNFWGMHDLLDHAHGARDLEALSRAVEQAEKASGSWRPCNGAR